MEKLKIRLRQTLDHCFQVTLDFREEQEGILPPLPRALDASLKSWQATYRQLEAVRSTIAPKPGVRPASRTRLSGGTVVHHNGQEDAHQVKTHLNQWLNASDSGWQTLRQELVAIARQPDLPLIPVLLDVTDSHLRRLPWQEWDLFEQQTTPVEVILRVKGRPGDDIKPLQRQRHVRILVVVGRSDGIRTQEDLAIIQKLKAKGAEVISLIQPNVKTLCEALWDDRGYHIFVFTGHSGSQEDGQIGWIEVNDRDSLSLEEFKHAFQAAINRGLQLAIFNSCDGLGLASQLAHLNLPRSIVMREPVPDDVAVDFLDHFFAAFTEGHSLFASVHRARKQLEHFGIPQQSEQFYPGVTWLPTLCMRQSALDQPLTWKGMIKPPLSMPSPATWRSLSKAMTIALVGGLIGAITVATTARLRNQQTTMSRIDCASLPQGNWRYGGSTTWAPIRGTLDPIIQQRCPDFILVYRQHPTRSPGSEVGIDMLLDGQLTFSQSSRHIKDEEYDRAVRRGFRLRQIPVAIDAIAIAVHPSLTLEGLTVQQLQGIYSGKITNWNQVGGPDRAIIPYSRSIDGGTPGFFQEYVLENQPFGSQIVFVRDTTEALQKVAQEPGAIYYASAPEVVPQCQVKPLAISLHAGSTFVSPYLGDWVPPENCPTQRNVVNYTAIQNEEYPFTRQLFVIVRQDGQRAEQVGSAYVNALLTDEGQQLIRDAGFIPVRE